ncbi:type II secretion system protein [Nocardioides sp. JQ2195]|uniref:type II secretion system F family protein n=1 Tax=Nocardioides sp. JQ2195 TaxID=2592334 RepID=UPI00143EEBDC|nr:type II secretion system F family protein [Nocardioides sp. JQ2195]QIX28235.1 type II secretion system protein [Nocardioides sp. JQ2195]
MNGSPLTWALVAAGLAATSVWLCRPLPRLRHGRRGLMLVSLLGSGMVLAVSRAGGAPWRVTVPVLIAVAAAFGVASIRARRRRAVLAAATGAQIQEVCEILGAELAAGLPVGTCLREAAVAWPPLRRAVGAHAMGGSVPDLLRGLAGEPGAGDLRLVAAAWQVAARSGSGLAHSLGEVAQTLRAREGTRRVVRSELASARSTARLMAVLPVLTLAMGSGVGGDPVAFLFGTPLGWGCLALGLFLLVTGLWWIESISAGVEATA